MTTPLLRIASALLIFAIAVHATPSTTTISGIIYRADGTAASGTLLLSWPAFNTANNQAIAAGTMSLGIGPAGAISLALAPTEGATPAGVSYKVIYKLDDGTTSTEIWVVPAAGPATIAAVRARVTSSTTALGWGNATQLQGKPIATTAPQNGQALIYSASASRYEPQAPSSAVPDADSTTKGKLQLAGDLGGTASAPTVPAMATKANQSALDATNSGAATHYSSTTAHSATATPAANRIIMSGASGKLDKGWLPSTVDLMTLGTGANGSPLSIRSPDPSNFLRVSAIDNGPNPGQADVACGAMHDISYPFGYNSVYGAGYDSSKPTFEEMLETNWCPGDGHAYFEWYKQFYAPWAGGAANPYRPIMFQVRKNGASAADYFVRETHTATNVWFDKTASPSAGAQVEFNLGTNTSTFQTILNVSNRITSVAGDSGGGGAVCVDYNGTYHSCHTITQNAKSGTCVTGDINIEGSTGRAQICIGGAWYYLLSYADTVLLTFNFYAPTSWPEPNLGRILGNHLPVGAWTLTRIHVDTNGGSIPTCGTTQPSIGYSDGNNHLTAIPAGTYFFDLTPNAVITPSTGFTIKLANGTGCGTLPAVNVTVWLQRTT